MDSFRITKNDVFVISSDVNDVCNNNSKSDITDHEVFTG
jgi:hypothetical protein